MVKKRSAGSRYKSLISISVLAHDMMILINCGKTKTEMREMMNQTTSTQTDTINSLIKAGCIERTERGKYKLTSFGIYLMPILKIRRER